MRRWYKYLDPVTLLLWLLLTGVGLTAIYSATHGEAQEFLLESVQFNFERQSMWLGICCGAMIVILLTPLRLLVQLTPWIYTATIVLLLVALLVGREVSGARSWVVIGPFGFQSSELAKIGAVLAIAMTLSVRMPSQVLPKGAILLAVTLLLLPAALIILQNDTGTALVFVALIPVMLFWGGLSLSAIALLASPVIVAYLTILHLPTAIGFALLLTFAFYFGTRSLGWTLSAGAVAGSTIGLSSFALYQVLHPHQVARILSFANPEAVEYRSGVGFHLLQSKAAIGSGGLFGQGFMQGNQTQGRYIPEQSTDFIFSVIGEEWGLAGSLVVLFLFAGLIIRLIWIASQINHPYGSLVAAGTAGIILIHVCINVGMVLGLLPVIGIPLPFLSYGGSALLTISVLIALALNMYARRAEFSIYYI